VDVFFWAALVGPKFKQLRPETKRQLTNCTARTFPATINQQQQQRQKNIKKKKKLHKLTGFCDNKRQQKQRPSPRSVSGWLQLI